MKQIIEQFCCHLQIACVAGLPCHALARTTSAAEKVVASASAAATAPRTVGQVTKTRNTDRRGALPTWTQNRFKMSDSRRNRDRKDHDRVRRASRDRQHDRERRRYRSRSRERDADRHDRDLTKRSDRRDRSGPRRSRSRSPHSSRAKRRHRSHSRSRSPRPRPRSRSPATRQFRQALPSQADSFGQTTDPDAVPEKEKQKPNFGTTGLLAKEANTVTGTNTVLKYHEPKEARKPPPQEQWRLYTWAQDPDPVEETELYTRSCWLLGRDTSVVDLELESERASKQHAVVQFRYTTKKNEYGDLLEKVKPYLIDLDSVNGTELNGERVQPSRYVELRNGDTLKFAGGEHEYAMFLPPADMIN